MHYRLRVRADECDSLGHLNNAVYIRHLQQATFDALSVLNTGEAFWNVRKLGIEYRAPAGYGDELAVTTWVIDSDNRRLVCGYRVTRSAESDPVVSAQIEWDYSDRATQEPRPLPDTNLAPPEGNMPAPLKPWVAPGDNGAHPFRWRHRVRHYELDSTNRVGTAVYFNWLEEATYRAANVVGWSLQRMQAEDFITFQYRHDAEFLAGASIGDEIEIVSRLIKVRRIRGTWIHEIFLSATNTLLMRDYSTGAFLDWKGNIKVAPAEMMEALVLGEPNG
jgi:YbgC/YbaW family acyl-CoA thioester hydrolase